VLLPLDGVQIMSFIKGRVTAGMTNTTPANGRSIFSSPPSLARGILVATLHQPGQDISLLLDDLLLLSPGGRVAYMGPWDGALPYFSQQLGLTPPPLTGLAEWFLALVDSSDCSDPDGATSCCSSSRSNASSSVWQQSLTLSEAWKQHMQCQVSVVAVHVPDNASSLTSVLSEDSIADELVVTVISAGRVGGCHSDGAGAYSAADSHTASHSGKALAVPCSSTADTTLPGHCANDVCTGIYELSSTPCQQHSLHLQQLHQLPPQLQQSNNCSSSLCDGSHAIVTDLQPAIKLQLEEGAAVAAATTTATTAAAAAAAGFFLQVRVLSERSLKYWWRNPAMVLSGQ
jgi:hypothetical protein